MDRTRREAMKLGAAALAGIGTIGIMPWRARAAGDAYATDGGEIGIHPVAHASLVMTTPGPVIYVDPVGDPSAYADFPDADVILITHQHGDHYAPETLAALAAHNGARLIVNPAVMEMLPADLKTRATAVANGETADAAGIPLRAIPAYNTTEGRLQYHPKGRDNGYVLEIDGKTVYIAGDTEDIPEMRALTGIDIAFVPFNLPYTMTEEQAASAVAEFRPAVVYPYHYRDSDLDKFETALKAAADGVEVVRGPWY
ncbi:MBL fold metallo-hydrolase [Albimonas pacifica]|uniref:L-ascorbate metabolism protein UlaG, beta-lactamase superfamily n=1 Tax=Albimonas pacifica TaxID=1114924 RepID=A0A1I3NRA2_9RHOB|nr:MBL fold metallo-hydrolase [Albimonas pacifica]SFJ11811.1 L-ascorbate metabolism protein UlaG, beta-lactamase superfamily [Albimonas pacifica]